MEARLLGALQHGFLRNVMVLLSGTAVAQLVTIVASLLLTRLFLPTEFGLLGVFSAILAISSVTISLRYEHAIVIEPDCRDGLSVVGVAMITTAAVTCVAAITVFFLRSRIADLFHLPDLSVALWLLPPALFLTGLIQSWSLWLLRRERMGAIARARIVQSLAMSGCGVAAGLLGGSGIWLVSATVAGSALGVAWLWVANGSELPRPALDPVRLRETYAKFRRFPFYTVPADLLSAGAAQLPIFSLGAVYGPAAAGAFLLTQRVLGAPLAVVGSAVMDAYKREAAAAYASTGDCRALTLRTIRHLALLSVGPWAFTVIAAPWAFSWAFGSAWKMGGIFCQLLATPLFLRFVTTPVSYNFYLAERQSEDFAAQAYNLGSNVAILWLAARAGWDVASSLGTFAANLTLVYAFYLWRSVRLARRHDLVS